MPRPKSPRKPQPPVSVAVVLTNDVVLSDFATPCDLFANVRLASGQPGYKVEVCGVPGRIDTRHLQLQPRHDLTLLHTADLIVVPGRYPDSAPAPVTLLDALCRQAQRGARIASICSGAFVLAEAGLLAGLPATTHWAAAADLAGRFPDIKVQPEVLFVDNGAILTSAGATAAVDMCLHIIQQDFGAAVAARTAKGAVAPLQRSGGQAQFIEPRVASGKYGSLDDLLRWIDHHLHEDLSTVSLARREAVSVRTLHRRFAQQTGMTPLAWVNQRRIRRAQVLLESSGMPVEHIAGEVGFGATSTFRERFQQLVGVSPSAYRLAFATT